jgi:hypothetical protein
MELRFHDAARHRFAEENETKFSALGHEEACAHGGRNAKTEQAA